MDFKVESRVYFATLKKKSKYFDILIFKFYLELSKLSLAKN